jgi:hypothetical protein
MFDLIDKLNKLDSFSTKDAISIENANYMFLSTTSLLFIFIFKYIKYSYKSIFQCINSNYLIN